MSFGKSFFSSYLGTSNTIKNYVPGDKYVILDIASRSSMPNCKVETNEGSIDIDLKKYQPGILREHTASLEKTKLIFVFQLLSNTSEISAFCTALFS